MTKPKALEDLHPVFVNRQPEKIAQMRGLYDAGLTDRKIAATIGVHHNTVASFRRRHQLTPNGTVRRKLDLVGPDHARCSRCNEVKPLADWPTAREGKKYPYRLSYCRECRTRQMYATLNRSIESMMRDRLRRLHARATKLGIPCTLELGHLMALYRVQDGCCFYTDIPMTIKKGGGPSRDALSIDKVEPARGYIPGNVVLCSYRINAIKRDVTLLEMKLWMPDWYLRAKRFLAGHHSQAGIPCVQVAPGDF